MDLKTVDHLLTTTRAVRKRLDLSRPVPDELIAECIEIAFQAPTGSNRQGWGFVVVTDPGKKKALGEIYRRVFVNYAQTPQAEYEEGDRRHDQQPKVRDSATYLAEHMGEAPALVVACLEGRPPGRGSQAGYYGSILPAAWSFMLAARARGLGTAWTSMHLVHEREAAELLGIPENVTQSVLTPVAYYTGDGFKRADRLPAGELTHWNTWGSHR